MFRPAGIQKRTALALLGAAGAALVIAGGGLFLYQTRTLEAHVRQTLTPYAEIIAANVQSAMTAEASDRANQILASLQSNPQILQADLLAADGRTLASYPAGKNHPPPDRATTAQADGVYFENGTAYLLLSLSPVGTNHAHLAIRMSLDQLHQHSRNEFLVAVFAGFLVLLAITATQLYLLRQTVLGPVARLAATADEARKNSDYSKRVPAEGADELARLGKSFNTLLASVEYREAEVLQKNSLLEGTLQATADGILVVSGDGKITSYNRQFVELWGLPQEILDTGDLPRLAEFLLQQLNNPAGLTKRAHPFNDTSKADTFDTLEFTDGRVFERFSHPQLVAGRVVGRVWSFRDVTARHWAVTSLRESEQQFKTLFESANDAIMILNQQVFIDCNRRAEEVFGCAREKIIGESPLQFSPERQADSTLSRDKAAHKIAAAFTGQPQLFEWIHCRADGTPFNAEVSLNRLEVRGQPAIQAIVRDVTARKQAENARAAAEELYRTLVNASPDGITVLDIEGRITFCSPRSLELFRLPVTVQGLPAEAFVAEAERPRAREMLRQVLQGGCQPHDIFTLRRADGTHFTGELNGAVLRDGLGVPCGLMIVTRDVTERERQQDEIRRKNEELERFTYTVSHDLKSPLITIQGFAGALLADLAVGQTHRLNEDLTRIAGAADKMSDLLNDLLELSRIGRIVHPPEEVSMNQVASAVVELLAGSIAQRQARVSVQPDLPAVQGDPQRLREVLQNLVENALKFSRPQPPPEIEIGAGVRDGQTVFFVRDHGQGIEPCYHETIFGLFNKLDARSEGTGIGLALVRRIVENHGGRIWVDSPGRDQGATFYFTLPPHPANSGPPLPTQT